MILKVLLQNLSKVHRSIKGFTLVELIVGMLIMILIGGLAMNAFIQASTTFGQDKKNIDSSQNLSAILELIGNDIKQSGEQMNDSKFPVVKIEKVSASDTVNMPSSSIITIRRALTAPLTLCGTIASGATALVVTDTSQSEQNCQLQLPLSGSETTTNLPAGTTVVRANRIKDFRDKRCQVDNVNGDYTSPTTTDYCDGLASEKLLAAVSDQDGHMRTFIYINDTAKVTSGTTSTYSIQTSTAGLSADSVNTYNIGDPIYLIEERIYKLDINGNFQMKRDNGTFETLIKGIKEFKVSARVYGNKDTKASDTINAASPAVAPNLLPLSRRCDSATPYYICEFNTTTTGIDDWKTIQGIKIELQAKYDAAGRSATATDTDREKLEAKAEFFPRNVLSK
jgi:Tfp pilus assembly protein PilW